VDDGYTERTEEDSTSRSESDLKRKKWPQWRRAKPFPAPSA